MKNFQGLKDKGWEVVPADQIVSAVGAAPTAFVLFTINDCQACQRALQAIHPDMIKAFGCVPLLVVFREMNVEDNTRMRELRVAITPQSRIYVGGKIVAAWQGLDQDLTDEDIISFNTDWMKKHCPQKAEKVTATGPAV